jgi:hypothetical protein
MQGLTGPGGLRQGGGSAPALTGPSMGPAGMAPAQSLADVTQLPENWLSRDMASGSIDWNQFAPLPQVDFSKVLNSYVTSKNQPVSIGFGSSIMGVTNPATSFYDKYTNSTINSPAVPSGMASILNHVPKAKTPPPNVQAGFSFNPDSLNFADKNIDAAIDRLNGMVYGARSAESAKGIPQAPTGIAAMLAQQAPKTANAFDNQFDSSAAAWTKTPLEQVKDQQLKEKYFADAASQSGMSIDDLKKHYGTYSKAYNTITDPVGANWQDLKSAGPEAYNSLLSGIRKYSGYDDAFFNNMNAQASEGTRNSQKYLSPEYFALHGTSLDNNYGTKKRQMIGNVNPFKDWGKVGNNPLVGGKSKIGSYKTNPYALEDYRDYLDAGSMMNATPEQIAAAQAAMQKQRALMLKPATEGGQFNLWKEANANPYHSSKVKGGGKWKPRNSGYTNQLNIAQNYLGPATEGKQNFRDLGYNEDKAYQSGFYFQKPKVNGFKKALGPILTVASFIPGPIGIAARIGAAMNAAANKNYIGAVLGGLGAMGVNPLGAASSKLAGATGMSAGVANAIVQGGVGGLSALQGKGNFLKGALGSGLGTYATGALGEALGKNGFSPEMAGAVSGGAGSLLSNGIQGNKGAGLLMNSALGAVSGYSRGQNIRKRQQQQRGQRK